MQCALAFLLNQAPGWCGVSGKTIFQVVQMSTFVVIGADETLQNESSGQPSALFGATGTHAVYPCKRQEPIAHTLLYLYSSRYCFRIRYAHSLVLRRRNGCPPIHSCLISEVRRRKVTTKTIKPVKKMAILKLAYSPAHSPRAAYLWRASEVRHIARRV